MFDDISCQVLSHINNSISLHSGNGLRKIEVPRDIRNSKSGNMISSRENSLNVRSKIAKVPRGTNARPKWDRTRCPEE